MGELKEASTPRRWLSRVVVLVAALGIFPLAACQPSIEQRTSIEQPQPSSEPPTRKIAYRIFSNGTSAAHQGTESAQPQSPETAKPRNRNYAARLEELRRQFTPPQLQVLEKLSRSDLDHLSRLENIAVPESWAADELAYSPLPQQYPWAAQHAKALIVHQPTQVFGGYEQGHLVHWGPVSSGDEKNLTPSGLFHLTWKSEGRRSTVDPDWYMPWYFNFENDTGISFHQYALPGYPASHACVRLLERDAQWLYQWGEQWVVDSETQSVLKTGTPVLIVGHYDFAASPPWLSLAWLAQGVELPSDPPLRHHPHLPTGPVGP